MRILITERSCHWYYQDGTSCFQVPKKDGNGTKDVTIREARQMGLLPGVTTILRVIAKPELESWKIEQGIMAALTLPRTENEPLEAFAKRVVQDSQEQASEAAEFGRRIHKAIEYWLNNASLNEIPEDVLPFTEAIREWSATEIEDIYSTEKVVVNHHEGYAGTLDLYCRLKGIGEAVVDFKTQGIKNGKPAFYDEWGYQLAAYGAAISRTKDKLEADKTQSPSTLHAQPQFPALVSVVINSREPGPIFCEQWKNPDELWKLFRCAYELWKFQKKYNPAEPITTGK